MKICLMTSVYALSESDRNGSFLVESTRHLKAEGHEVMVFAPSYEGLKDHFIEGVPVHRFRYFFKSYENLTHGQGAPNRIRNPIYLFVAFFYILFGMFAAIRFCRREKFDVIHVHWPFPHGIWGWAAGKASGTPMVLTFHGAELLLAKKFFFINTFIKHAIKHCKGIICNSTFTAAQVSKLTDKTVNIIPFGVTVNIKEKNQDKSSSVRNILFAGRIIERKGLEYLIRSISLMDGRTKTPVHLNIVGEGNVKEVLQLLTTQLNLDDKITFHGFVPNAQLEDMYSRAELFVLPAIVDDRGDTEGLGVVLVEALSYQIPVVASRVGGIPDVIIDDETGVLVQEKAPEAIANAIQELLNDGERADRLVKNGFAHACSYFDWNRITNLLTQVYKKSLD